MRRHIPDPKCNTWPSLFRWHPDTAVVFRDQDYFYLITKDGKSTSGLTSSLPGFKPLTKREKKFLEENGGAFVAIDDRPQHISVFGEDDEHT